MEGTYGAGAVGDDGAGTPAKDTFSIAPDDGAAEEEEEALAAAAAAASDVELKGRGRVWLRPVTTGAMSVAAALSVETLTLRPDNRLLPAGAAVATGVGAVADDEAVAAAPALLVAAGAVSEKFCAAATAGADAVSGGVAVGEMLPGAGAELPPVGVEVAPVVVVLSLSVEDEELTGSAGTAEAAVVAVAGAVAESDGAETEDVGDAAGRVSDAEGAVVAGVAAAFTAWVNATAAAAEGDSGLVAGGAACPAGKEIDPKALSREWPINTPLRRLPPAPALGVEVARANAVNRRSPTAEPRSPSRFGDTGEEGCIGDVDASLVSFGRVAIAFCCAAAEPVAEVADAEPAVATVADAAFPVPTRRPCVVAARRVL